MKIAITGHRPNKLGNDYSLSGKLISKIKEKLQEVIDLYKPDTLISGMALGIDTLWAKLAHENNINLIAAIPCKNQEKMWVSSSKIQYWEILENPLTTIVNISDEEYSISCMQKRNEWMVDNCDLLVAVWDGTNGGTGNCVSYAKAQHKEMIIINPTQLMQASVILEALKKQINS